MIPLLASVSMAVVVAAMVVDSRIGAPEAPPSSPRPDGRRVRAVREAWPDVLRDVLIGVRSGLPLEHALVRAAGAAPSPLGEALGRFESLTEVMGPVAALESIRAELADPVSDRVAEVLKVAVERGGTLPVVLLGDLADSVSADLALAEEIDAAALEHRINAVAVAVLPWLVLGALIWSDGPYRDFYFSAAGWAVIGLGAAATALGSWAVVRIGRIPEEIRIVRDGDAG